MRLSAPGGAHGSFAFLVADAKTRAVPLAVPPIALVQKSEYQPGERAELLVGGSAASGTYHLELWRGATLVEHRLERGAPVRVWTVPIGDKLAGGFTARFIGVAGMDAVGGDVAVAVPRKDKALTVKLVGKPDALEPGQSAKWTVEVKDEKGRAVDGEALVTIFDRSLELYARQSGGWADALWAPPPPPPERAVGAETGYGMSLPGDEAAAARAQKEIEGHYVPRQTPRFSWEQTAYGGYGYGGGRLYRNGPGGPPPPPAMAAPAAPLAEAATTGARRSAMKVAERGRDGDATAGDKAEGGENAASRARRPRRTCAPTWPRPPPSSPTWRWRAARAASPSRRPSG